AGSTIVVGDTTTNQGAGAIAASVTRYYLSTDPTFDASDVPLPPSGRAVPDLAAGASSTGTVSVTIPASTTTGSYYLIAKADADNALPETQEGNNTALRVIQIGGDLVVSALTVPTLGSPGGTILVSDTTTNQGAGGVPASVTKFYLSANTL